MGALQQRTKNILVTHSRSEWIQNGLRQGEWVFEFPRHHGEMCWTRCMPAAEGRRNLARAAPAGSAKQAHVKVSMAAGNVIVLLWMLCHCGNNADTVPGGPVTKSCQRWYVPLHSSPAGFLQTGFTLFTSCWHLQPSSHTMSTHRCSEIPCKRVKCTHTHKHTHRHTHTRGSISSVTPVVSHLTGWPHASKFGSIQFHWEWVWTQAAESSFKASWDKAWNVLWLWRKNYHKR